jgi:enoyl-CoA hydratase
MITEKGRMGSLVRRDDFDGWTRLTLNRPDKLNALTAEMFTELRRHVVDGKTADGARCVILRGAGTCLSAGHDLADIAAFAGKRG